VWFSIAQVNTGSSSLDLHTAAEHYCEIDEVDVFAVEHSPLLICCFSLEQWFSTFFIQRVYLTFWSERMTD